MDCLLFDFVWVCLLFFIPKVMCLINSSNSISKLEIFSSFNVHCDFLCVFLKLQRLK